MCGHFAINYMRLKSLVEKYGIENIPPEELDKLFSTENFYPSRGGENSLVPVILEENGVRRIDMFRWDIVPGWWHKPLQEKTFNTFNARAETLTEKSSFKSAWSKNRRCIVPATSFFEWPDKKLAAPGTKRREHQITLTDQEIFSLAAIWDVCTLLDNTQLYSCTLITLHANETLMQVPHTRMPAILRPEDEAAWLDRSTHPEEAIKLLRQYPADKMAVE